MKKKLLMSQFSLGDYENVSLEKRNVTEPKKGKKNKPKIKTFGKTKRESKNNLF